MMDKSTIARSETNAFTYLRQAPGPRAWELPVAIATMVQNPVQFAMNARRRYGDVVRLHIGPAEIILLNHPEHARHVLVENAANYDKSGGMWDAPRLLVGNGLVTTSGSIWRRHRRMIQPQFDPRRISVMASLMTAITAEMLDQRWASAAMRQEPLNLGREMTQITVRFILRAMFGSDISSAEIDTIGDAVSAAANHIGIRMWLSFLPKWAPIPGDHAFRQRVAMFDQFVQRTLVARRSQWASETGDLLSLLSQARDVDTGQGMDDKQIRDELATLFVGGFETTSGMLTWSFYLLCRHANVERKMREEVSSVLGDRIPTFEDLARLKYTSMVLKESMRLYPPFWLIPRTCIQEDSIDGYRIPAKSAVVVLPYVLHRHPDVWVDPDVFDPERFDPARAAEHDASAHLPFGVGARQCAGKSLAMMEGVICLAMALQRYRMRLEDLREVNAVSAGTLRPDRPIRVLLERVGKNDS